MFGSGGLDFGGVYGNSVMPDDWNMLGVGEVSSTTLPVVMVLRCRVSYGGLVVGLEVLELSCLYFGGVQRTTGGVDSLELMSTIDVTVSCVSKAWNDWVVM